MFGMNQKHECRICHKQASQKRTIEKYFGEFDDVCKPCLDLKIIQQAQFMRKAMQTLYDATK